MSGAVKDFPWLTNRSIRKFPKSQTIKLTNQIHNEIVFFSFALNLNRARWNRTEKRLMYPLATDNRRSRHMHHNSNRKCSHCLWRQNRCCFSFGATNCDVHSPSSDGKFFYILNGACVARRVASLIRVTQKIGICNKMRTARANRFAWRWIEKEVDAIMNLKICISGLEGTTFFHCNEWTLFAIYFELHTNQQIYHKFSQMTIC